MRDENIKLLFVALAVISVIVMAFGFINTSITANKEHYKYKNSAVSITAAVTDIKENIVKDTTDGSRRKEYRAYITYEYDGVVYSNIYWKTFSRKSAIGNIAYIKVLPDDPTNFYSENDGHWNLRIGLYMFGGVFVFMWEWILAVVWEFIKKDDNTEKILEEVKPALYIERVVLLNSLSMIALSFFPAEAFQGNGFLVLDYIVVIAMVILIGYKAVTAKKKLAEKIVEWKEAGTVAVENNYQIQLNKYIILSAGSVAVAILIFVLYYIHNHVLMI